MQKVIEQTQEMNYDTILSLKRFYINEICKDLGNLVEEPN